jgi:transcriptional regulator of acetoin/glycerol metabolism
VRASDLPLRLTERDDGPAPGDSLDDVERAHIAKMLEREGWNITHTASKLEIDRVTLYNKIKKYGLRK